jgi:proteasome assembly chaperone (PAC2) family protein
VRPRSLSPVLTVDHWPPLDHPLMVVALSGWVDAGGAGEGAVHALLEQLADEDAFAEIDLTDLLDLQQTRPTARFAEGGLRVIEWPSVRFVAGRAGRDVVVVHGPEPSLRWPAVAAEIVDVANRVGASEAATLGGMPALVSHRRALPVLATATSRSLAQEVGPLRPDYAGPTGTQTIVQHALGAAGIPCVGFWVQVPQYVAGSPSPPAVRALLARLAEVHRVELRFQAFDARSDAYLERVEEGLTARPDVKEIVDRLDRDTPREASGELVDEIERYLRSQSEE